MRVMLDSRSMSGSGACKSRPTRFSGAFDTLPAYELKSLFGHHAAGALLARHDACPPHPGVEGAVAVGAALGCEQPPTLNSCLMFASRSSRRENPARWYSWSSISAFHLRGGDFLSLYDGAADIDSATSRTASGGAPGSLSPPAPPRTLRRTC